jgi:hypothetical protein
MAGACHQLLIGPDEDLDERLTAKTVHWMSVFRSSDKQKAVVALRMVSDVKLCQHSRAFRFDRSGRSGRFQEIGRCI